MKKHEEIITEEEWFNRMLQKKIYDVLFIDWQTSTTRVLNKFTGEVFDVTLAHIGKGILLRVTRLG